MENNLQRSGNQIPGMEMETIPAICRVAAPPAEPSSARMDYFGQLCCLRARAAGPFPAGPGAAPAALTPHKLSPSLD